MLSIFTSQHKVQIEVNQFWLKNKNQRNQKKKGKKEQGIELIEKNPKNEKQVRIVPIHPNLQNTIQSQIKSNKGIFIL